MIFGFGKGGKKKKKRVVREDDDEDDDDDDQEELVLFQGAVNGQDPDLKANVKLVKAGLLKSKQVISDALSRRAEMVRIEPKGPASVVSFFVDGIPYPAERMPANLGLAVTQMIKLLAGLDIKQRTQPQSGAVHAQFHETPYLLRVDTQMVPGAGERLVVRASNKNVRMETPDDLGFSDVIKAKIRELAARKQGLMLAVGPPMSGVSTTAFALIRGVDAYMYTVYSLASMLGRDTLHIKQFEGNEGDNFVQTLNRAKLAEGDVIFVDPIRDAAFAKTLLDECENVTIVSEMQARDASDAVVRLVEMAGSKDFVAERLSAVFCQKLIRSVCPKCRQAYRPNPTLLQKVGLPPETKVLYRAVEVGEDDDEDVCETCGGAGYLGRTALIELIEMTPDIRALVKSGADAAAIKAQARKEKMQTFQTDGVRVAASGKTTLEELQRAFKPPAGPAKKKP